jgi:hypothetical protein
MSNSRIPNAQLASNDWLDDDPLPATPSLDESKPFKRELTPVSKYPADPGPFKGTGGAVPPLQPETTDPIGPFLEYTPERRNLFNLNKQSLPRPPKSTPPSNNPAMKRIQEAITHEAQLKRLLATRKALEESKDEDAGELKAKLEQQIEETRAKAESDTTLRVLTIGNTQKILPSLFDDKGIVRGPPVAGPPRQSSRLSASQMEAIMGVILTYGYGGRARSFSEVMRNHPGLSGNLLNKPKTEALLARALEMLPVRKTAVPTVKFPLSKKELKALLATDEYAEIKALVVEKDSPEYIRQPPAITSDITIYRPYKVEEGVWSVERRTEPTEIPDTASNLVDPSRPVDYSPSYRVYKPDWFMIMSARMVVTIENMSGNSMSKLDQDMQFVLDNFYFGTRGPQYQLERLKAVLKVTKARDAAQPLLETVTYERYRAAVNEFFQYQPFGFTVLKPGTRKERMKIPILQTVNDPGQLAQILMDPSSPQQVRDVFRARCKYPYSVLSLNHNSNAGLYFNQKVADCELSLVSSADDILDRLAALDDRKTWKIGSETVSDLTKFAMQNSWMRLTKLVNKVEVYDKSNKKNRNVCAAQTNAQIPSLIMNGVALQSHMQGKTVPPGKSLVNFPWVGGAASDLLFQMIEECLHSQNQLAIRIFSDNVFLLKKVGNQYWWYSVDASKMEASISPPMVKHEIRRIIEDAFGHTRHTPTLDRGWLLYLTKLVPSFVFESRACLGDLQIKLTMMPSGIGPTALFNNSFMAFVSAGIPMVLDWEGPATNAKPHEELGRATGGLVPEDGKDLLPPQIIGHYKTHGLVMETTLLQKGMRQLMDDAFTGHLVMDFLGNDIYAVSLPGIGRHFIPVLNYARLLKAMVFAKSEPPETLDNSVKGTVDAILRYTKTYTLYLAGGWSYDDTSTVLQITAAGLSRQLRSNIDYYSGVVREAVKTLLSVADDDPQIDRYVEVLGDLSEVPSIAAVLRLHTSPDDYKAMYSALESMPSHPLYVAVIEGKTEYSGAGPGVVEEMKVVIPRLLFPSGDFARTKSGPGTMQLSKVAPPTTSGRHYTKLIPNLEAGPIPDDVLNRIQAAIQTHAQEGKEEPYTPEQLKTYRRLLVSELRVSPEAAYSAVTALRSASFSTLKKAVSAKVPL